MDVVWGSILVSVSIIYMVLFAYYYKNKFSQLDKKLEKLDEMLASSEDMVDELNDISDFVTAKLESTNLKLLRTQDDIKSTVQTSVDNINHLLDILDDKTAHCNTVIQKAMSIQEKNLSYNNSNSGRNDSLQEKLTPPKEENPLKTQAIKMANEGADIRTIAKSLRIGQGEVELFLINN